MEEIKQVKKDNEKKKKRTLISLVILAIVLFVLLLISFRCGREDAPAVTEYEQNVNAITEIDHSEQQKAVDAVVEEGKMNVNYSPKAVFDGKTSVLFNVKNITELDLSDNDITKLIFNKGNKITKKTPPKRVVLNFYFKFTGINFPLEIVYTFVNPKLNRYFLVSSKQPFRVSI